MNQTVIVTTREALEDIVARAVQRGVDAVVRHAGEKNGISSLTEKQAAAYLGQACNTLRQWRSQGRGPAYEKRGRAIRYKQEDLDSWRNANRVLTVEALESLPPGHRPGQLSPLAGASRG